MQQEITKIKTEAKNIQQNEISSLKDKLSDIEEKLRKKEQELNLIDIKVKN